MDHLLLALILNKGPSSYIRVSYGLGKYAISWHFLNDWLQMRQFLPRSQGL